MSPDSLLHSEADEVLRKAATQLRQRLETNPEDGRAETVLKDFPSLASDPSRALELIVLEFHLRRQRGQNPQPVEWYERFPHWREVLRLRLEGPPSGLDTSERETALLRTSPYYEADRPTVVDAEVDAPVLERHEILEEVGRGGMGVVYRARDLMLDRLVALKVIRSGTLASDEEVRRFYREARAAAQLRHPNIVPIYGMGLYERQHCFTMALFPRGSLAEHLADYRRDVRSAVGLAVKVARAVQAAHERGIIHRDLKPGNILLDEHGEPVVSDFGLAKHMESSATLTLPAHPVGTPAYMAPEQTRCEAATAASDIWSLGVVLYELLAGRRPFAGDGFEDVMQKILHADLVSPRRLRPDLPRDLETIVLTCLEKAPARRYPSAAALADDLERWLRGEPIHARPEPRWHRWRRQFHRRVGMKGALLLLVGLLLMGAGAASIWTPFIYLSPAAREQRRQEQVLASLQRELAEGKSVTLVGPLGSPKWYRWRTEKNRPPLPELRKWPFALESVQRRSMLELLPDPRQVPYRFSAEVQSCAEAKMMEIGLYFSCEELATPTGPEQCFGLFRLIAQDNRVTKAELCLIGYAEQDVNEELKWNEYLPCFTLQPRVFPNIPPSIAANPTLALWRPLEVHVRHDRVQAFCDGCLMGDYAIAKVQKPFARLWRTKHPAAFPVPDFSPRGGLGLYLSYGTAFFRNVVVEPLPQP